MTGIFMLHAPSIALIGWSVVFLSVHVSQMLELLALLTIAVAMCLHTRELVRAYRRRDRD